MIMLYTAYNLIRISYLMSEVESIFIDNPTPSSPNKTRTYNREESLKNIPLLNKKGSIDGLRWGKLVEKKNGGLIIKARSTINFIFQILIWIFLYSLVLSGLMILKLHVWLYSHILMIFISFCAIGIATSITLFIFYPLVAPHIFDFHLGFFYTKPLSFYIHFGTLDSIRIVPLSMITAIEIIRVENYNGKKWKNINQTNLILHDGSRIALTVHKNELIAQTKEDAQKLATRLIIPVWDNNTVTA